MNITLSAVKKIIEKARKYAQKRNTSLNELIRDYLNNIVGTTDRDKIAEEFEMLARDNAGKSSKGYKFNREEIYER